MILLRNKLVAKIIAVLVAFAIWAYVIISQDPISTQGYNDIPINLSNVERLANYGLVLFDVDRESVNVSVSGAHSFHAQYGDQITVFADVLVNSEGQPVNFAGQHFIAFSTIHAHPRLTIEGTRPIGMWITVENLVTVERPINVSFVGDEIPNTEPGNIFIQPAIVEITGAQPLIEAIEYVEVEIQSDQIERTATSFIPHIKILDEDRNPIYGLTLSTNLAHVEAMLYDVRAIPLSVEITGTPRAIHEVIDTTFPSTIRVRGTRADLANVHAIIATPIDISELVRTTNLPISFTLPEGLALAYGQAMPNLRIEIETMANTSFEFDSWEIEIRGLEEGLNAQFEEMTFRLIVGGDDEVIEYAERDDFRLSVNLEGLEVGTHSVDIIVTHEKELRLVERVPMYIYITIEEE